MEIISTQKYLVASPRKIREVARLIKNLSPNKAIERLPFVGKRATLYLKKVIVSAIANARQKGVTDESSLIFKEIQINEGPRLKRWNAGARGRAKPYKRRMAHIRIVLAVKEKEAGKLSSSAGKSGDTKENKSKLKNQISKLQIKNKNEKK